MTPEQLQNEAVGRVEAWVAQSCQDSDRAMEQHRLRAVRDASGELVQLDGKHFEYDGLHRLIRVIHPSGAITRYSYGENDRLCEINDDGVRIVFEHDPKGRVISRRHGNAGACIFRYDAEGRLAEGRTAMITTEYLYDSSGRATIRQTREGMTVEASETEDSARLIIADGQSDRIFANGTRERIERDPVDGRLVSYELWDSQSRSLCRRSYEYDSRGRIVFDGTDSYEYDENGHLICPRRPADPERSYRFNDEGQMVEAFHEGARIARCEYDHDGRLAWLESDDSIERYIYGRSGQLLLVTDDEGRPIRRYIQSTAEIRGSELYYLHFDHRGICHTVTDKKGAVIDEHLFDPYGVPLSEPAVGAIFGGREWNARLRLYWFGWRWYDPAMGRFLTPDTFTGGPDDARLLDANAPSAAQGFWRSAWLADWLKQPQLRDPYAFCCNDPINRVDPDGHWSFGWVLLSLLGAIWSLPNTMLGIALELTVIAGEVLRWILFVVSIGHISWATPGFDAAASGRLNAFALVFRGGWLSSLFGFMGLPMGNVFFVHDEWEKNAIIQGDDVKPVAYSGTVTLKREEAFYEHMLRHTIQASIWGPFYWFLPPWGLYIWVRLTGGGSASWFERDAREFAGL